LTLNINVDTKLLVLTLNCVNIHCCGICLQRLVVSLVLKQSQL